MCSTSRNRMALTLELAEKLIAKAKAKSKEMDVIMSIAVVDDGGHLVAFERMDGGRWHTPMLAIGKAYTSAGFRTTTDELQKRFKDRQGFVTSFVGQGKFVFIEGGVPILENDKVIGAIGVSGGTGQQDKECADAVVNT